MQILLEQIFDKKEKSCRQDPNNWMCKMTNLVGGQDYQHPHADQAWPGELEGERTFPFVATHGFGKHTFEMWLLTKGLRGTQQYGILHQFPKTALLFLRGDFVHAGGAMWFPRCHMKFYPKLAAGLVFNRPDNYWLHHTFKINIDEEKNEDEFERTFLWQHFLHPFAFPKTERIYNDEEQTLEEILSYPPALTSKLLSNDAPQEHTI